MPRRLPACPTHSSLVEGSSPDWALYPRKLAAWGWV